MRIKDLINPLKWISFIKGKFKKYFFKDMQPHVLEQYLFRRGQCTACIIEGKCVGYAPCDGFKCDTWAKMLVANEKCHCGRWGQIRNKEEWEQLKRNLDLKTRNVESLATRVP